MLTSKALRIPSPSKSCSENATDSPSVALSKFIKYGVRILFEEPSNSPDWPPQQYKE
jgi:hypothetical protein